MKKITLKEACGIRDRWSLSATGSFGEGIHLVSGDVGCGKSTLALMMAGYLPLSGGSHRTGRPGRNVPVFPEQG
jgi:energy-coupling factor transport system ATP-binding protein